MQDSIFTRMIRGEIPCYKIYEDELTLAFLDIYPIVKGHTLVIPKKQVENVWDLPDQDYEAVWTTARKVAERLDKVLTPNKVGVKVMGTDVPHAHVHLIPFNEPEEFHTKANHNESDPVALQHLATELAFD